MSHFVSVLARIVFIFHLMLSIADISSVLFFKYFFYSCLKLSKTLVQFVIILG